MTTSIYKERAKKKNKRKTTTVNDFCKPVATNDHDDVVVLEALKSLNLISR